MTYISSVEIRFEPVVGDSVVIGHEAVLADRRAGDLAQDLAALESALELAAPFLGDALLFVAIEVGAVRETVDHLTAVAALVRDSEVPADQVVLQIGVEPACASHVGRALAEVRRAGIRVAVDEVLPPGACGCASLVVDPDWIKIHESVVDELGAGYDPAALRQVLECAAGLEAVVVAEGVRTEQQARTLEGLGVRVQQGPWHRLRAEV